MINKKFDKELYKKYDETAKEYAIKVLNKHNLDVRRSTRKTEVDLIVIRDGKKIFYVEVEIKKYLKNSEDFKCPTLHIPQRKSKYTGLNLPTLFMLFSEDGSCFLCVWDKFITESPLKEVKNKYVASGEFFFDVDIKKYVDDNLKDALKRMPVKNERSK